MFIFTPKKKVYETDYTVDEFKSKFDSSVQLCTYTQLRKSFHLMDLYYGGRVDDDIQLHFHRYGKRDLDNPFFNAKIVENANGKVKLEGYIRRKISNIIWSIVIMLFWIFATIVGFTQSLLAGSIILLITLIAVYIFFWDNQTPKEIDAFFDRFKKE